MLSESSTMVKRETHKSSGGHSDDITRSDAHKDDDAALAALKTRTTRSRLSARVTRRRQSPRPSLCHPVRLCVHIIIVLCLLSTALSLFGNQARASSPEQEGHEDLHGEEAAHSPHPSAAPSRPRVERLYATSIASLKSICEARAPQLTDTTWAKYFLRTNRTYFLSENGAETERYAMLAYPVCVHRHTGILFAEDSETRVNRAMELIWSLPYTTARARFHDLNDLFASNDSGRDALAKDPHSAASGPTEVRVVPALAIFPFGSFISSHMWHLINDALARFVTAGTLLGEELWRVPRQAVLVDEEDARWLDRRGDTPQKMRLSAAILNGLSTFTRAPGPACNTTHAEADAFNAPSHAIRPLVPAFFDEPLVVHAQSNATLAMLTRDGNFHRDVVCFCQAAMVPVYPYQPPMPPREALVVIQDRTALSFGAPPYRNLTEESVWDIERQRIERYPPWARQFWPATTTAAAAHTAQTAQTAQTAVYQPRVLFIHRAKRTIANVAAYVRAMRDLGFRVEEVYLERLPTDQQYYLGRYADVVVGMHGLGIGHALWMNRYPTGCRTVIEFRLWASPGAADGLEGLLSDGSNFSYHALLPYDVRFGSTVPNKRQARLEIIQMWTSAYQHPGWDDQEAIFLDGGVRKLFKRVKTHLDTCLKSV